MDLEKKVLCDFLSKYAYEYYPQFYNSDQIERAPLSFNNIGNICYCNVSLQLILSMKPLCLYLLKEYKSFKFNSKYQGDILETLIEIIKETYNLGNHHICTNKHLDLLKKIKKYNQNIIINEQNDAHEFLLMLLDFINVECNRCLNFPSNFDIKLDERDNKEIAGDKYWLKYLFKDNSVITDLLGFQNIVSITCENCNHTRYSFEFCIDMGLEINDENLKSTSLIDLIKNNLIDNKGTNYNLECNNCKLKNNSKIKKGIYRMPNLYMVIYIKRFKWIYDKYSYNNNCQIKKIDTNILLPQDGVIDFTPLAYMSNHQSLSNSKYVIESIIYHSGNSYNGHYTATVKFKDGFYICNDEIIRKIKNPYNSEYYRDIYMLLLKRVDKKCLI